MSLSKKQSVTLGYEFYTSPSANYYFRISCNKISKCPKLSKPVAILSPARSQNLGEQAKLHKNKTGSGEARPP